MASATAADAELRADTAAGHAALVPLAEAKLAAPRLRAGVERPRIMRALDAGAEAALTLVVAPPGYGKTTAVRAWCASRETALAWVTLDSGDNDPFRLWTYVATAVDRVRQGLGQGALRRLRTAGGPIAGPIDELMNGIAAFGEELVIVLDDLQTVNDTDCLASLDHAVHHLPVPARAIALTRTDPALRLSHLRAGGALAELRADELAFTTAEARELIVERGGLSQLEPQDVEVLREHTEGWPAALVLALLWLRSVRDQQQAVRDFGADHRFVADYLSEEVFASLDDDAREFMWQVSTLGRFTAELCDGVLGRTDSAAMLAGLERSNLLVIPLERGGWFRVHSLVAEFADLQLAAVDPHAAERIHRRAAAWYRSRHLPVEAVEQAAVAEDHELVAGILAEHHLALIRSGASQVLLRWVRTLPDDCIVEHPELATAAATAAAIVGHGTIEVRRFLRLVTRAQAERPELVGPYVRAAAGMVRAATLEGGVTKAVQEGRRAVHHAQAGGDASLVAALGGYARALYFAGDLDRAWTAASRAVEHPDAAKRPPGHAFARSTLALVAADRGHLAQARAQAEKAKDIVGGVGSSRNWLGANAAAALGSVLAGEGNLAEAERELAYAERCFRDEVATVHHAWLLLLLARVRCGRGHLKDAEDALSGASEAIAALTDIGRVPALAHDVERELRLANARAGAGEILELPSAAESTVLRLLATDLSASQIAHQLFLSPNTVRSHTRAVYRKLGVNSRADAVARAGALGLLGYSQSPR